MPNGQSVKICKYGEYPQDIAPAAISKKLEKAFQNRTLDSTGKQYTFDQVGLDDCDLPFKALVHKEYTLDGKRYIRVLGKPADGDSVLSDGQEVEGGKPYWLEVKPIEWLVDPSGIWLAKKGLFSGIRFNKGGDYDGNFAKTEMKSYLDNFFSKEMQASRDHSMVYTEEKESVRKTEPGARQKKYGITVEDEPLSVKEQIDFYVKNGMSFMLHGVSGIGKTGRVEAIDPNLTAVPLWNGVLPEDIVGKVRYPNGEVKLPYEGGNECENGGVWVPPDWYVELCKKCEAEPNKMHVLFLDEVTNARPTTQSLIFHIALKKSISPSKGKLPKNAVVVLAGNSKEESGAAYNMPEPLFRRMCGHIYLEPNVADWLEWASEKSFKHPEDPQRLNVHPLISSFVGTYGNNVFYSAYNEENPGQWAIDPRGWEQVSDIIYDNKGVIRRELLENKIGPDLTANLLAYAKNPPLSVEEVLNDEYTPADIPEGNDARLALALSLRHVGDRQVGKVREFIRNNLGKENEAAFDSLWIGKNDERAIQISQLRQTEKGGR